VVIDRSTWRGELTDADLVSAEPHRGYWIVTVATRAPAVFAALSAVICQAPVGRPQ